jgi:hypothetical protein
MRQRLDVGLVCVGGPTWQFCNHSLATHLSQTSLTTIALVVTKDQALNSPNATLEEIEIFRNRRMKSVAQPLAPLFDGQGWTAGGRSIVHESELNPTPSLKEIARAAGSLRNTNATTAKSLRFV